MTLLTTQHVDEIWLAIGLLGQLMFCFRFVLQWLASEKAQDSVIPDQFWYFSIAGGVILFFYAMHKMDPVFMLGQGMGILIYLRNLQLIKEREQIHVNIVGERKETA